MQLGRGEELAAGLVADEGIVLPTALQPLDHVEELAGTLVTQGVLEVLVAVEVL